MWNKSQGQIRVNLFKAQSSVCFSAGKDRRHTRHSSAEWAESQETVFKTWFSPHQSSSLCSGPYHYSSSDLHYLLQLTQFAWNPWISISWTPQREEMKLDLWITTLSISSLIIDQPGCTPNPRAQSTTHSHRQQQVYVLTQQLGSLWCLHHV